MNGWNRIDATLEMHEGLGIEIKEFSRNDYAYRIYHYISGQWRTPSNWLGQTDTAEQAKEEAETFRREEIEEISKWFDGDESGLA